MERAMGNLAVGKVVGGLVTTQNESVKNAKKLRIWRKSKKLKLAKRRREKVFNQEALLTKYGRLIC